MDDTVNVNHQLKKPYMGDSYHNRFLFISENILKQTTLNLIITFFIIPNVYADIYGYW